MKQKDDTPRVYVIECTPYVFGETVGEVKIPASIINVHSQEVTDYITQQMKKRHKKCSGAAIADNFKLSVPVVAKVFRPASSIPPTHVSVWAESLKEAKGKAEQQWDLYLAHYKKDMNSQFANLSAVMQTAFGPVVNEPIEESKYREITGLESPRSVIEKAFLGVYDPATSNPFGIFQTLTVLGGPPLQVKGKNTKLPPSQAELRSVVLSAILCSVLTVEETKQELAVQTALGSKDGYLRSLPLKVNTEFLDKVKAAYDSHQISTIEHHIDIYQRGI